jgi:hypothetical protein
MRLTVGPLPPAVYWRRRAVVLGTLLIVVLALFYTFGGSPNAPAGAQTTVDATSPAPTEAASPTVLTPIITDTKPDRDKPSTEPSAFTLPTTGTGSEPDEPDEPAGPAPSGSSCTDAEIEVVASAASTRLPAGKPVDLTIKFRNVGDRSCKRDIGADAQELKLLDDEKVIWSSDDCNARHGTDVRTFRPDEAVAFTLTWNGRRSRSGTGATNCATAPVPAIGTYALVGRLDSKDSSPVAIRLT